MQNDHVEATKWAYAAEGSDDPLLSAGALAMAAASDPAVDHLAACAALPDLVAASDLTDRSAAFGRYLAVEATLACARLDLAADLSVPGPPSHEVWAGHPYAGVMV